MRTEAITEANLENNPRVGNPRSNIVLEEKALPMGVMVETLEPPFIQRSIRTVVRKGSFGFVVSSVPYWNTDAHETQVFSLKGFELDGEGNKRALLGEVVPGTLELHNMFDPSEPGAHHQSVVEGLTQKLAANRSFMSSLRGALVHSRNR